MNAEANPRPSTQHMLEGFNNPDMKPKPTLVEAEVMPRKPISERQLAANRANSLKSTGPRTRAGKEVVRANAITHGLYATVLSKYKCPGLIDEGMYEQLVQQFQEDFKPKTQIEMTLIESLAVDMMRLRQIQAMEARFYQDAVEGAPETEDPRLWNPHRLEEGETEEQVQHEATVARRLYLHMDEGKPHPLPPKEAEAFADKIYQIAINAEDLLVELRQELEELQALAASESIPTTEKEGAPADPATQPVPETEPEVADGEYVTQRRKYLQTGIQNIGQRTREALGVPSREALLAMLLAGSMPPEDRLVNWLDLLQWIVSRANSILRDLDLTRRKEEQRQANAQRRALDGLPRLDQLVRREAHVRRNIERTLKQLNLVRHDLFI